MHAADSLSLTADAWRYAEGGVVVQTWNREYYDIMSFYYWEPQHLGKIKNSKSKIQSLNDALVRIANMEVSLNHQFNLFFQLIPNRILRLIISQISPTYQSAEHLTYQSNESINNLNLNDATQPDIFFIGDQALVGIEFKVTVKTSIEQLLKYAMLFYFSQRRSGRNKACHLIYVGCGEMDSLFSEPTIDFDSVKEALNENLLPDRTKKGGVNLVDHKSNIVNLAKNMAINFINYQQLYQLFIHVKDEVDLSNPYAESVVKLFDGITEELIYRKLAMA